MIIFVKIIYNVRDLFSKKWFKIAITSVTLVFALIGFFLCASYFAIRFGFTNTSGRIDINNRYLTEINKKYEGNKTQFQHKKAMEIGFLQQVTLLDSYYPINADKILDQYHKAPNIPELNKMLDIIQITLDKDDPYLKAVHHFGKTKKIDYTTTKVSEKNAFNWVNFSEWDDFKLAVKKDKQLIDSVSKITGVESRLIVSCLVGEQIRLFNSKREIYKKVIRPLKILSVESMYSYGVTGIKDFTAEAIENHLKDKDSPFYLGSELKNIITYPRNPEEDTTFLEENYITIKDTVDTLTGVDAIRMDRLIDYGNHYYSYLYAALFLKQIKVQWESEGFPIDNRPGILVTLFNLGFAKSKPKKNPKVGGAQVNVYDREYTFGMLGLEFYYSGELSTYFPIHGKKFDNDTF